MRRAKKPNPELESRVNQAKRRMRDVRRRLSWQAEEALAPLSIQKELSISELRGEVLIVTRNGGIRDKIKSVLESDNYRCDAVDRTAKAIGLMKLTKYQLVIVDCTRYHRRDIYEYVRRYQPHIKVITIARDDYRARQAMRQGGYSYLLGHNFDPEQLRTCLISSLRLKHRVCWLQEHGERCNRSCVNSYQTDEDFDEDFLEPD